MTRLSPRLSALVVLLVTLANTTACDDGVVAASDVADSGDAAPGRRDAGAREDARATGNADAARETDAPVRRALPGCWKESLPLRMSLATPYVEVRVGSSRGLFLLDYGATYSTIDANGFDVPPQSVDCPSLAKGQTCTFSGFDFFGAWGAVRLTTADHEGIRGTVPQAGIVGTDFLSVHAFALDYEEATIYRVTKDALCTPLELSSAGFASLSTAGYFSSDPSTLLPLSTVRTGAPEGVTVPNVPTVPVRLAGVEAVAQLDTGFADPLVPFALNINRAFFDRIMASAPEALTRSTGRDVVLTTCVPGVRETVLAYTLAPPFAAELADESGKAVRRYADAVVFLKETPTSAASCGGIGTWTAPAAQIAGSFFVDTGAVYFDPVSSRVWMPRQPASSSVDLW